MHFGGQGRRRGELDFQGLADVTSWGRHLRQKEHMGEGAGGCVHKSTAPGRGACRGHWQRVWGSHSKGQTYPPRDPGARPTGG